MPNCTFFASTLRCCVTFLFVCGGGFHAQAHSSDVTASLRNYFSQCHAARVCNGSVLVARAGKVVYEDAFGDVGIDGQGTLSTAHAFDIGSVSKQFTAAAVLRLVDHGKLRLDDTVDRHLPGFPYPRMTLRQLLNHSAGVPDAMAHYTQLLRSGKANAPMLGEDVVQVLAATAAVPKSAPGERFEYSNTGYLLLARVVSHVTGLSFADFLQREFFGPLRMSNTGLRMPGNEAGIAARAYGFRGAADGQRRPYDQIPGFYMQGAGGIYSTVGDLLIWSRALRSGVAMSANAWREATTPTRLQDGSLVPYGFGFGLRPSALQQPRISHGGHWRAFKAELSHLPAQDIDIVILSNNGEDKGVDAASRAVEAILASQAYEPVQKPGSKALSGNK
ncbi:UNVERIFIED_ORG: CubicO group peptidase (beta-lactamase class C family) [Zoogloea ramigera]|uniref:Serine hydrolase domain-containing protein n=1 Tax=Duganella zoogloeoides TaxID=75659 RepID=A0ABZ0XZP5_9BURK|nr:serine hydrolase domain-containing protein [Duganella zoogloeoides]WQH05048.1 serine hydrolase domain-containing protein [Duganella zoogloeoides]